MQMINLVLQRNDDGYRGISFDEHGVLVINGWTVSINHEAMRQYLRRYAERDMNENQGFFIDIANENPAIRNGVLSHNGARMAFYENEIQVVVDWLSMQYGADL
jgi:hypothetical protein